MTPEEFKAMAIKRRAQGLCGCGRPKKKEKHHCVLCAAAKVKRYLVRAANNKAKGLCSCGKKPVEGGSRCLICRNRRREQKRRARMRGNHD